MAKGAGESSCYWTLFMTTKQWLQATKMRELGNSKFISSPVRSVIWKSVVTQRFSHHGCWIIFWYSLPLSTRNMASRYSHTLLSWKIELSAPNNKKIDCNTRVSVFYFWFDKTGAIILVTSDWLPNIFSVFNFLVLSFILLGTAESKLGSGGNRDEDPGGGPHQATKETLMDQEKLHSLRLLLLDELLLHLPQLKDVGGVQAIPFMQVCGDTCLIQTDS